MSAHPDKQRQVQQHTEHGTPHSKGSRVKSRWLNWVEEQNRKNDQRASKPDNIVVLKFAVILCVGLLVWCYYVYVGRICTPMIRQDDGARGSRAEGITFLIFFNILWLLMSYSYALVCLTPPGFARDVVQRGPRPEPPWLGYPPNTSYQPYPNTNTGSHEVNSIAGPQYMSQSSTADANAQDSRRDSSREVGSAASDHTLVQTNEAGTLPLPTEDIPAQPHTMDKANHLAHPLEDTQTVADRYGKTGALGAGIASAAAALDTNADYNRREGHLDLGYRGQAQSHVVQSSVPLAAPSQVGTDNTIAFKPKVFREPPNRLPLHPNTRYCERCEIVKPYRAHHCRHCGTCILGMDHHCPWIGQCCGARNHIYFVVFCFWSCLALGYVFVTLLIALIAPNVLPKPESIDVQTVVVCAIAAVLSFFTGSMLITHIVLILNGQSTIENISISDMKHRETSALNRHYSLFSFKAKKMEKKLMDKEWGKLDTEAHLWYQGNKRANWVKVMGSQKWKWFLPPPGSRPDHGVSYTPNPRHGPNGEWRRREDWPRELQ